VTDATRRPGPWWTLAVLLVGLVLYVLSAGPAGWLIGRCGFPEWLLVPYEVIYKPLELVENRMPSSVTAPFDRYIGWWLADYVPPTAMGSSVVSPGSRRAGGPIRSEATEESTGPVAPTEE